KMIRYESIFYGLKSLLYGLPISIGIMYLMYKAFSEGYDYSFTLPWISILIAIFAVFLIVGTTIVYASSKVKKKNIIDALKQENIYVFELQRVLGIDIILNESSLVSSLKHTTRSARGVARHLSSTSELI